MAITTINTIEEFEDYIKSTDLLVIHFQASGIDQCTQVHDFLQQLCKHDVYHATKYAELDAEELPALSLKYDIKAVPTVVLLKNLAVVGRVDGVDTEALGEAIKKHSQAKFSETERLKALINQAPCMLFMKGDPQTPRCGFSRTIIEILNKYKTNYQSFDILQDNTVREGLKKYSNWPTYPQLYVNGELIGGLDIIKEMDASGELETQLPKKI